MTTCKERTIFEQAKPAKEFPADWFVIPALDVGRYIKQNYVAITKIEELILDYHNDLVLNKNKHDVFNARIAIQALEKVLK